MHGGDIYSHNIDIDFSVSLNPFVTDDVKAALDDVARSGIACAGNYPDILQRDVRSSLSKAENVSGSCVLAGSGASELIMAVTRKISPHNALLIEPSFSGYRHALSSINGCKISEYHLKEEDGYRLTEGVLDVLTGDVDMAFLQDPWNPTGSNTDPSLLDKMLDRARDLGIKVLLDESFYPLSDAYTDGKRGALHERIKEYEGLYIIRSYTKCFALPGIRMGYVISSSDNINGLRTHLPEWNLSTVASSIIIACSDIIGRSDFLDRSVRQIASEREYLCHGLEALGLIVYESDTLFVMFHAPEDTPDLYDALIGKGILIRSLDDMPTLGRGYYRAAVRRHEENIRLIASITEILNGN